MCFGYRMKVTTTMNNAQDNNESQLVRTEIEEYAPLFDEETGEYTDVCPYEKYSRGQNKVYSCPCICGRTLNNRQQFLQHFKTKAHANWLKNMGKDGNVKLIKELRIENGKKDNKIRLQARHMKRLLKNIEMLEKELSVTKKANSEILKYKNDVITDLQDNIKLLEEATGHSIEYDNGDALDYDNDNALPWSWDLSTTGDH